MSFHDIFFLGLALFGMFTTFFAVHSLLFRKRVWRELLIRQRQHIVGRGLVFTVNLVDNNLAVDEWVNAIPIRCGDVLRFSNISYTVTGVEASQNLLNNKLSATIGLVVSEI